MCYKCRFLDPLNDYGVSCYHELRKILEGVDVKGKSPIIGAAGEYHFDEMVRCTPDCKSFPSSHISNDREVLLPSERRLIFNIKTYAKYLVRIGHGDKAVRHIFLDNTEYNGPRRLISMPFDYLAFCHGAMTKEWDKFSFFSWNVIREYSKGRFTADELNQYTDNQCQELDNNFIVASINLEEIINKAITWEELIIDSFENDYKASEWAMNSNLLS